MRTGTSLDTLVTFIRPWVRTSVLHKMNTVVHSMNLNTPAVYTGEVQVSFSYTVPA